MAKPVPSSRFDASIGQQITEIDTPSVSASAAVGKHHMEAIPIQGPLRVLPKPYPAPLADFAESIFGEVDLLDDLGARQLDRLSESLSAEPTMTGHGACHGGGRGDRPLDDRVEGASASAGLAPGDSEPLISSPKQRREWGVFGALEAPAVEDDLGVLELQMEDPFLPIEVDGASPPSRSLFVEAMQPFAAGGEVGGFLWHFDSNHGSVDQSKGSHLCSRGCLPTKADGMIASEGHLARLGCNLRADGLFLQRLSDHPGFADVPRTLSFGSSSRTSAS